jgi:aryl-alcohol dehydrogenase-like predicted oxidoreductase
MRMKQLGKDGPEVSAICFGAMELGGRMGPIEESQAIATAHAAIDAGVTFFDTAEGYATSEEITGKALVGKRDQVFLATKLSGDQSKEHIAEAFENSLRMLKTDHIDLYQLHRPKPQWPIEETMGELVKLQEQGKIGHIGLSNFSAAQTAEAMQYATVISHQPRYSMLFRESEEELFPFLLEAGVGSMVYAPLAKGLLSGKYGPDHVFTVEGDTRAGHQSFNAENMQAAHGVTERLKGWASDHGHSLVQLAVAWTQVNPAVTATICGAKSPEQIIETGAAGDWVLSASDLAEVETLIGDVRLSDG